MKKDYPRGLIYPLCLSALLGGACAIAIAGCGSGGVKGSASSNQGKHAKPSGGVLGVRVTKQPARKTTATGAVPRFFSPSSVWNRVLSPQARIDPSSTAMVASLNEAVQHEEQEKSGPWINTKNYSVPIYTVSATQPTVPVTLVRHTPEPPLSAAWSAVPLPEGAQPAGGTDAALVVWQPSSDRMWEFWQLHQTEEGWQAVWGGAIQHASRNSGVFGPRAWPGAKTYWGVSASSLALAGGVITIEDLERGEIDHALAISLPEIRQGVFATPAERTDGRSANPSSLPEGARLRINPNVDLASRQMPPLTRMLAEAAQRYGILVRDYSTVAAFSAEDPVPTGSSPYTGPEGFFEGRSPSELLASFPWADLQVLAMNLHRRP